MRLLGVRLVGLLMLFVISACQKEQKPPNIIFIVTDQQSESMMSSSGNTYIQTPAMDYIAHNGIRFTRAYVTNPVCSPSRVSMLTGRFPGYFSDKTGQQVRNNGTSVNITAIDQEVLDTTLPAYLRQAGYELVFGGKQHFPTPLHPESLGFQVLTEDGRDELAARAAEYIQGNRSKPYFMMVSLINPHDICYMAIRDFADSVSLRRLQRNAAPALEALDRAMDLPEGVDRDTFFARYCPPLPPNFEIQEDEAKAIGVFLDRDPRSFRRGAREEYTEEQWRMHRWAYARLTERADAQVQVILDALKASGQEENTLVIFSSDHGDLDGSHRLEHKNLLYEESVKVPFSAMWKGKITPGQVNDRHLISLGLDLLPTVAEYAGVEAVADPRGMSLKPLFEGLEPEWRETLGIEGEISRAVLHADGLKYVRYDAAGFEERLMDLAADPFETTHFTWKESYKDRLETLRGAFENRWFPGH
ncbi:MAG: sulfatase-like hydrolase/transferase [Lunatimonas sp.]|uniref:sulfatase family protein n=1 Tax=Lunatimonas sp. TaxID=2060141 RepID=UPI00263AA266|nr:sulfatase-like hydrolase/transferase [Lunatimonas sp.]MCC5937133.1 sulfatase-like hydrolase/transferase [Lunatimonas sp.]